MTTLNTSSRQIEGTINSSIFSMGAAKCCAFGPSAKYSSHADESTTFTVDPSHAPLACRSRAGSRAFSSWAAPVSAQCDLHIASLASIALAEDRALRERREE